MSQAGRTPPRPDDSVSIDVGTIVRWVAAAAIAIGGLIHLQLYFDGYRDFPNANLGRSFVLNGVSSIVVACAMVVRRDALVRLAGVGVLAGTLVAFFVSRTDSGIFGFAEKGLNPSPQALLTLVLEIGGLVLIGATFIPDIGPGINLEPRVAAPVVAVALVGSLAGSALWARTPERPEATPVDTAVSATTPASTPPPETSVPASPAAGATTVAAVGGTTVAPTTAAAAGASTTAAGGASTTAASGDSAGAEVITISIADFAFDQPALEIPVGTTVEWVNNDDTDHDVTSDDGSFVSETLAPGDTFTYTFTAAGDFPYICSIHPQMTANIVVTA